MPYTSDKQNSESFKIVPGREAVEYLNITIIAGSSSKMEDPERFLEAIIFKPHVDKYLITKFNQYKSDYCEQVHPDEKETDSLFYLNPWICVSNQG